MSWLERDHSPLALIQHPLGALSSHRGADALRAVVGAGRLRAPVPRRESLDLDAESVGRALVGAAEPDGQTTLLSHTPNNTASYVPPTVYAYLGATTVLAAELFAKCNNLLRGAA